jgi:hypothetical protein
MVAWRAGEVGSLRCAGEVDCMVDERGKLMVYEVEQRKLIVARRAEEVGSLIQGGGVDGMLAKRGGALIAAEVDRGKWKPSG